MAITNRKDGDVSGKHTSTVIDFDAAVQRITSDRVARLLADLAGNESVRVLEALACAITNGLRSEADIDQPFAYERVRLLKHQRKLQGENRSATNMLRRIANRALRGTLYDHTRGLNAFHRVEVTPGWSVDILPLAVIGPFVFYRI